MKKSFLSMLALATLGAATGITRADAISDAISAASTGLVNAQNANHAWTGAGADGYNGTIIAGLVSAYQTTNNAADRTAAQSGATAIMSNVAANNNGIFLGDEVYSLTQVSNLQSNPNSNAYHDAAYNFFNSTVPANYGSTTGFVNALVNSYGADKTQATIYLSYYTLAAYNLNLPAQVQTDLRNGLISTLGKVADLDSSNNAQIVPTGALGAAVWALASTGPGLDSTVITGPSSGQNVFGGDTLAQLPGILDARLSAAAHTFDYDLLTSSPYDGATDADALSILGLAAADAANAAHPYDADLSAARLALAGAVDMSNGSTSSYVNYPGYFSMEVYAGRTLQALQAVPEPASTALLGAGALGLLARRRKSARTAR